MNFFNVFINVFLLTMGVIENVKYKNLERLFFTFYLATISLDTFGMMVGIATVPNMIERAIQFSQLLTQLNCISMMLYYKFSMNLVLEIIRKLRKNYTDWKEAAPMMEHFVRTFVCKVFIAYYFAIVVTIAPIFAAQLRARVISEKYSYVTPFWYSCGTQESIFKVFCWNVQTSVELLMSNAAQSFGYYCTLHALIMLLLFYTVLTNNVRIHAQILTERSREMVNESKSASGKPSDVDVIRQLHEMMKHQQFVRSFANDVTKLVHWMVVINMAGIFGALSMTAFFTVVEKTNDSFLASKMASMSLIMIITLYIYCFNAQQISDLNNIVMESMLEMPWYRQSLQFRKKYAIALCLNQVQVNVKAAGMFEVNLKFFQSFMRAIYSVLNVLLLNLK